MTLIEVLIASAILVFGMVGVLSIINAASRAHKRAVDETNATLLGASKLAEVRALFAKGYRPASTGEPDGRVSKDYPGYRYRVNVADLQPKLAKLNNPLLGREFFVEVKILWGAKDEPKTVTFQSIMFLRPREGGIR